MRFKTKGGRAKIKSFVSEPPSSNFASVLDQNQMNTTNMQHDFAANSSSEEIFDQDTMETDWTENHSCIKCDKSGDVLFCSGSGCPLVVHQKCIPGAAYFDDTGKFLCPYCLCKHAMSEVQRAKTKANLAKKVLSKFIDTSMVDGHEPKEKANGVGMKEQNQAKMGEDGGSQDFENRPEVSDRFVEIAEHEQRTETSDSRRFDSETIVEQRTESVVEPPIVDPITSYWEPGVNVDKIVLNQNKEVSKSSKSSGLREGAKPFSNPRFPNARRKKRHWTVEEEEMLKEGVHKFSTTTNKNVPWRKILEFGRHVFDATRNPVDLKDKWRNMWAKDALTITSEQGKNVSR